MHRTLNHTYHIKHLDLIFSYIYKLRHVNAAKLHRLYDHLSFQDKKMKESNKVTRDAINEHYNMNVSNFFQEYNERFMLEN